MGKQDDIFKAYHDLGGGGGESSLDSLYDDDQQAEFPPVSLVRGDGGWVPEMGEEQLEFYWDESPYVLAVGERGSGKTTIGIDKLLRHAYQYTGALIIIVTILKIGAKAGGIWEQISSKELDHRGEPWGNLQKWRKHVGLTFSEEYGDDSKNRWIEVGTKDGGSSSILLLSMPYGVKIKDRIKDLKMSYFHIEELTNTDDSAYFYKVIPQLKRRPMVPSRAQQYVGTCNPADEGEDSWVFKSFFVHKPVSDRGAKNTSYSAEALNPYTRKRGWDTDFGVHHIPAASNRWMEDMAAYQRGVMQEAKDDPTVYDRMILGKWVARVKGNGIFGLQYSQQLHLRGELGRTGLMPIARYPIIVGADPGNSNNARVLLQRIYFKRRYHYRYLDCLATLAQKVSYRDILITLYDRMLFWCKRSGEQFDFEHIGDEAAFNQYNAASGSYDYMEFERISKQIVDPTGEFGDKYAALQPIYMKPAPKGAGSIGERVRCVRNLLTADRILVSGLAPDVDRMFRMLRKSKDRHGNEANDAPLKDSSGLIHIFDAASYPVYYYESNPYLDYSAENERVELECGTF